MEGGGCVRGGGGEFVVIGCACDCACACGCGVWWGWWIIGVMVWLRIGGGRVLSCCVSCLWRDASVGIDV